jgi:twinkle protein
MMDDPSETIVSRGPCPNCSSSDNCVTYADGHQFCYSPGCGLVRPANKEFQMEAPAEAIVGGNDDLVPFSAAHIGDGLKSRKLVLETLSKYGYFVHKDKGKAFHLAPYYDQGGQIAYQKYRDAKKNFWFQAVSEDAPKTVSLQLFGQHVWGEKHDKKVIVTEGELDALSVAQATKFKIPVVSVVGGISSAVKCLKANYRWLDRFEEIILWFDNDEPGQSEVPECADLFEPGKVKTIKVSGHKDASEMLQAGKEGEVYAAVWSATTWAPAGIVNAKDCVKDVEQLLATKIANYPFPRLQEMTLGILEAEVVYHVAGTGVGKTSVIVEIQNALLEQGVKFGVMRFEDTRAKTQLDLMSRRAGRPLHLSLEELSEEEKKERTTLHTTVFGAGLVELFDPETASWDFDALLGYIRYMSKALDCKVIFIDPLSFLVAAMNEKDERKALDNLAYQLARLVKQTGVNLQITHHLSGDRDGGGKAFEEGRQISIKNLRGSAGIAMFAMAIIAYERNQQGERPDLVRQRLLKNRFAGPTGVADILKWLMDEGHYEATDEAFPDNDNEAFGPAPVEQDY